MRKWWRFRRRARNPRTRACEYFGWAGGHRFRAWRSGPSRNDADDCRRGLPSNRPTFTCHKGLIFFEISSLGDRIYKNEPASDPSDPSRDRQAPASCRRAFAQHHRHDRGARPCLDIAQQLQGFVHGDLGRLPDRLGAARRVTWRGRFAPRRAIGTPPKSSSKGEP